MTDPTPPRSRPHAYSSAPRAPMTPAERLETLVRWLFGDAIPEKHQFRAGDVLIAEGEALRRPALLVIEGEIEECIGSYSQDSGPGEHTVHVARTGDLADAQALVAPYCDEPAQCSVHAMTSGSCYPIWRSQLARRPELDAVLSMVYEALSDALERQRALAVEAEDLANRLHAYEGENSRRMSASEVLDEWDDVNQRELGHKLEEMQDELDKAQLAAWEAKERQEEAQKALDLERRARAALEQRVIELMRQLANQGSPETDKFPSAIRILESAELEEMEAEARRHRDMAENYVERARMLHRAFELLAADNPDISIRPDVMQLMLGEEPPSRHPPAPKGTQQTDLSSTQRSTVPLEEQARARTPPDLVQIPRSAKVPDVAGSIPQVLDPDHAPNPHETPSAPGTKRSGK